MYTKVQKNVLSKIDKRQVGKGLFYAINLFVSVFLLFLFLEIPVMAKGKVVKVGAIEGNSFIEDISGVYHGYGVEYLEEIAKYTDWEYEYVFDSWENCIKMFENGEVDILCNVQKTPEREQRYLYSCIPFGYDYSIIYAHPDSDIYYEDYDAMKGKKVGLISVGIHTDSYLKYAEKMELDSQIVYFELEDDMITAILNGKIDMCVTGSIYNRTDMKVVGRFGTNPYYIVMQKHNAGLMEELDEAMQHIKVENPGIEASLAQKYYGDTQISSNPLFTKEEQDYIRSRGPITIRLMEEVRPLSYTDGNDKKGVFVSYLELLSQKTGLQFEIEIVDPQLDAKEEIAHHAESKNLMLRESLAVDTFGMDENLLMSNPLITSQLSYFKSKDQLGEGIKNDYVFAVTKEMAYFENMLKKANPDFTVKYYDTPEECFEALINNEADIGVQNSYIVSYHFQKPKYAELLTECPGQECINNFCLVASEQEQILIQIINKAVNYISEEEKTAIITAEVLMEPYNFSLADIIYRYWKFITVICSLILLLVATYTILMRRTTKLKFQKKEYELLEKKVQQDELTGVFNRPAFYKVAKKMIDATDDEMCIVLMDISNFKVVNDLYGINVGDRLLKYMAAELTKIGQGREFIVGRFNSDHFYMCMKRSDFDNMNFPQRYKTFLEDIDISVIYGVYSVKDNRDVPINIMCDRASLAAHDKERKRGEYIRHYSDEERQKLIREQEVINDIEKALEGRQFSVYIQPKYNIFANEIIGGEALVRWIHPQKGMISPAEFIPILEKNGFITQLDYYVWEETCRFIAGLKEIGYPRIPISVNVSRAHFYGKELREKLMELIKKYQLETDDIELEITESICVEDSDIIYKKIEQLRNAGFKIAMDDFGSGYSSLNMLKDIPLDVLKMDMKFLDGGENEQKSQNIIKTLIVLAKSIDLQVVVEGVETEEQIVFLRDIGCRYVQGYYYSRPIEAEAFEAKLKEQITEA